MRPPPFLSASLMSDFERCSWQWARKYRSVWDDAPTENHGVSYALKFGSDYHALIEEIDGLEDGEVFLKIEEMFGEEADDVYDYIREIQDRDASLGLKRIAREAKFEIYVPEIGVTLTGHIDDLLETADGKTLIIRDYKTGLKWESAVAWTNRIQPRLYNWAVRHPDFQASSGLRVYENYRFEICYPRQQKTVDWELIPETPALLAYVASIWLDMVGWYEKGFAEGDPSRYFPQILNQYCRNCHVRSQCDTYLDALSVDKLPQGLHETDVQALLRLMNLEKAIKGEIDARKSAIKARFPEGSKTYEEEGHNFTTVTRSSRSYKSGDVLSDLYEQRELHLEALNFDKLFTLVNSEVDRVVRAYPFLKPIFEKSKKVKPGTPFLSYAGTKDRPNSETFEAD